MKKDVLTIAELSKSDINEILTFGKELKAMQKAGVRQPLLEGKSLGMIFEKPSTRTRVSFEVAMYQLGGHALFLSSHDLQLGRGETIADTARVLSRYVDGLTLRTFAHKTVEELAQYATVPVVNALSDRAHPCQVLADLMTIREQCGENLAGLKLAYIGDGNNMANSLRAACEKMDMAFAAASPAGYALPDDGHKRVLLTDDVDAAVDGADVVYTDVWVSMGDEAEREKRLRDLAGYQVNARLLKRASKRVIVMHCLPAHRGEEIAAATLEKYADVIFSEAENRLHVQKAILALTMGL